MSPLSFFSDRAVPATDSSELKHENTRNPQPAFFIWSFSRGGRAAKGAPVVPTCVRGRQNAHPGDADPVEIPSQVKGTGEPRAGSALPCSRCGQPGRPLSGAPAVVLAPLPHVQKQPAAGGRGGGSRAPEPVPLLQGRPWGLPSQAGGRCAWAEPSTALRGWSEKKPWAHAGLKEKQPWRVTGPKLWDWQLLFRKGFYLKPKLYSKDRNYNYLQCVTKIK